MHRLARAVRDVVEALPCARVWPPGFRAMRHDDLWVSVTLEGEERRRGVLRLAG